MGLIENTMSQNIAVGGAEEELRCGNKLPDLDQILSNETSTKKSKEDSEQFEIKIRKCKGLQIKNEGRAYGSRSSLA